MNGLASLILVGIFLLSPLLSAPRSVAFAAVVINEIYPKPSQEDAEWIELFNNGSESVSLDRWKLQNSTSPVTSFTMNASFIIGGNSFLTIPRSQSDINLNNEGDTATLFDPNNNQVDSQGYPSVLGFNTSVGRTVDGGGVWAICITPATPNAPNNCPKPSPTPTPLPTATPMPTATPFSTATPTPAQTFAAFVPTTAPGGTTEVLGVDVQPTPPPSESVDFLTFKVSRILLLQILLVIIGWGSIGLFAWWKRKSKG